MAFGQRRRASYRPRRNTAPMWKKLTIVVSAVAVAVAVMAAMSSANMNFGVVFVGVLAAVAADVWVVAKLIGVHLSLSSWD